MSSFNTTNVIDMRYMFKRCINLTTIDLSSFEFENCDKKMMFYECKNLKTVKINKDLINVYTELCYDNDNVKFIDKFGNEIIVNQNNNIFNMNN